jgi:predicted secreted protein
MPVWLIALGVAGVIGWFAYRRVEAGLLSAVTQPGSSATSVTIDQNTTPGDMGAFELAPTEALVVGVYPPPAGYAWYYTVSPLLVAGGASPGTLLLGQHDNTGATFTSPQGLPTSSIINVMLQQTVNPTAMPPLKTYTLRVASGTSPVPPPPSTASKPGEIELADADDMTGKPPVVAQTAVVRLTYNPQSGYQWSLNTTKTTNMSVVGHRNEFATPAPTPEGPPPGPPTTGTAVWEFQRTGTVGTAVLELRRPSDPATAVPSKSFMVAIMQAPPREGPPPPPPPTSHGPSVPPPPPPPTPIVAPAPAPAPAATTQGPGVLLSDGELMQHIGALLSRR